MAIKPKAAPASAKSSAVAETAVAAVLAGTEVVKLTISVKRRMADGSEIFIAPGLEVHCAPDELDAKQAEVTERLNNWITSLVEMYPNTDPIEAEAESEPDEEEAGEEEAGEAELTEDDINAMGKPELVALIKENELEIDTKLPVAKLRAAIIEAMAEEGDGDEEAEGEEAEGEEVDIASLDDDSVKALAKQLGIKGKTVAILRKGLENFEDADAFEAAYTELFGEAEGEGEEGEEGEGDEESGEGYTEEELNGMKLEELQGVIDEWGLDAPEVKKGAPLPVKKKAYVKAILDAQNG